MSDLIKEFGEMLRFKRKAAGYSQEGFATYVGIERGNYGKMERGNVNIKLETLYRLTNALNCEFNELMPPREKYKIKIDLLIAILLFIPNCAKKILHSNKIIDSPYKVTNYA
ncbi:helix-turn-helix domain-containing protein [Thalassotalea sp. PLHSN55]|uniref:helix-turn-helix domain-containing protein n=1 Tax=Thalassotalea sp. PLHSN55 TaxID=3435888 RepID=UPI003F8747FF